MLDPKKILSESHTIAVLGVNKNHESYANKIVNYLEMPFMNRSRNAQVHPI